jgi:hypothetical protein
LRREDVVVRRLVTGSLAPVSAGVIAAVFAAAFAYAQPVLMQGLRAGLADDDASRRPVPPPPQRRDTRPVGAQSSLSDTGDQQAYGHPPGFGAGRTGFISTNTKRRAIRRNAATVKTAQSNLPPPLSLTATGVPTNDPATAAPRPLTATPAPPPRTSLVRIPDGTPGGAIAGTVSANQLPAGSAILLRRRTAAEEDAFAQVGMRAGAFIVSPAIEVTGGYDTNPARAPGGRASSLLTVAPELLAKSDWERHEVTVNLRGSYTAYGETPELDRPAVDGKIAGRLDVTRDTSLLGEGTLIVGTDNPGSPNVQAGLSRFPIFTTLGGSFGIGQRFNRLEVTAKATAERTEYQDSHFTDGTTETNHDRDFNRYAALVRVSYDLMPGIKPFVEGGYDLRDHDEQFDRFGIERDSTGWTLKAGSSFSFARALTGEFAVGYLERDYKDPSLQKLQGISFDASLIYALTALTNVKLTAQTVAGETTVPGTAGILTRTAGAEVEHTFRRWLIGSLKFNYGYDDYVGSPRKDNRYAVSASLIYKLNRMMQVKGEVREEWLRSSVAGVDYNASVFLLGMRLQP